MPTSDSPGDSPVSVATSVPAKPASAADIAQAIDTWLLTWMPTASAARLLSAAQRCIRPIGVKR